MAQQITLQHLQDAIRGSAAAFRCRRRFQPGGWRRRHGFSADFRRSGYAVDQRHVLGRAEPAVCVLLEEAVGGSYGLFISIVTEKYRTIPPNLKC